MLAKKPDHILTLDAGTTSVRALLINRAGEVAAEANRAFRQLHPRPGWHEQSAAEIWQAQREAAQAAVARGGVSAKHITAIGITNQRETTTIWSRKTGEPLYNAINWGDRRVAPIIDRMLAQGWEEEIKQKTGVLPDATFSAGKIIWLLDNVPGLRARAAREELAWGTIDTWLLWNLTGGRVHATDVSNASRTMLMNLHTLDWDSELLAKFQIPVALLPEIRPTSGVFGETQAELFGRAIPVTALAGDQQAALFGQACFEPGMAKKTFGTAGCFDLNAGPQPLPIDGLVTNVGWKIGDRVEYTVEGVALMSGSIVQWLRDQMEIIADAADTGPLAAEVEDTGGVYLVPAHQGLNAPYWDMYARGALLGCSLATTRRHVVRAALESMAYQTRDIVEAVHRSGHITVTQLRIDGGGAQNEILCQFLADLLNISVVKPKMIEATALGAAYLAGLAVGFWNDREEISRQWKIHKAYEPQMSADRREALYAGWRKAVSKCLGWLKE
ncbi:MAG: glycerol kinase GlpK [Desulfobacterales bacterium]|nr:MAG: glycerol kinase GlpK [Desulfobacterales bacterium]